VNEHARGDVEVLQLENARLAWLVAQMQSGDDMVAENAALQARLEQVGTLMFTAVACIRRSRKILQHVSLVR